MRVRSILGTMTFGGEKTNLEESKRILESFRSFQFESGKEVLNELDTAIMYNDTVTEKILGECSVFNNYIIASKANPNFKNGISGMKDVSGLSAIKIKQQIDCTLESLRAEYVDLYYLHWPSPKTDIMESLRTINQLHKEGKIKEFGLSNYSADMTRQIHNLCVENNFIVPTVYQGLYNVISRKCEELLEVLKELNIRFYAFNPLAGGLLTGRYQKNDAAPEIGRFNKNTSQGKRYQSRYFKDALFDAVEAIQSISSQFEISCVEIAIRWLYYHSHLSGERGDAVILGASTAEQMTENLQAVNRGPLPVEMISLLDDVYASCEQIAPSYYR